VLLTAQLPSDRHAYDYWKDIIAKVGDPISLTTISRDIQALDSLGFLDDVQFDTESVGNGMIITFSVKE